MLKGRNIGRMRVLLTVEQLTTTRNAINEGESSWSLYGKVFAERVWKPAGEKFEGAQETWLNDVEFNARFNSGINTTMRFKQGIDTSYFYITNVRSSRREGLTIINATRRDNQGNEARIFDNTFDSTFN